MINKLARLLLNSIKTSQPKEKIIRLAKLCQKLAARLSLKGVMKGEYHEVMIDRFLQVFSGTPGVDKILTTYLNNLRPNYPLIGFDPTENESNKGKLTPLLEQLGTKEISLIEKEIVESKYNRNIKNYLENKYNVSIDPIKVKEEGFKGKNILFVLTPSTHFAYRAFFRGVEKDDIKNVLRDFTQSILQGYQYTVDDEGKTYYVSNIKKYGYYITLVVADITKVRGVEDMYHMTLVTIYPNEDARRTSYTPVSGFITPTSSTPSSKILTPEEFLSTREEGTGTIAFKVWTKGTEYTDANTVPAILEYPKQLEKHIGISGITKIAKRIGVTMLHPTYANGGEIKVQIDCPICYHLDGKKTDPIVLVFSTVKKESDSKYKIINYRISNSGEIKQRSWWERDDYSSTR